MKKDWDWNNEGNTNIDDGGKWTEILDRLNRNG